MGQYFVIVNPDKEEYIRPELLKLTEVCGGKIVRILPYLLADGEKDGTTVYERKTDEDGNKQGKFPETEYFGRWSGDRIVMAGDYGKSGLWDESKEDDYTDITEEAVKEFEKWIFDLDEVSGEGTQMRPDLVLK